MRILVLLLILGIASCALDKTKEISLPLKKTPIFPEVAAAASNQLNDEILPTPIVPTIEKLCPPVHEVPLSELHLDEMTRLLLRLNDRWNDGLWTMAVVDQKPKLIPNSYLGDQTNLNFEGLSPDGKWLLLHTGSDKITKENRGSLWIISVDGSQQRKIASIGYEEGVFYIKPENDSTGWSIPDTSGRLDFYWSDIDEITFLSQVWNAASLDPLFPIFVMNSTTLQGENFFKTQESAGWNVGLQLGENYTWNSKTYEVYKRWYSPEFFLYDRVGGISVNIFK